MNNVFNNCDVLDLSIKQSIINRINIQDITKIILNVDLIKLSTYKYTLKFNDCDVTMYFSNKDRLIKCTYRFTKVNKKDIVQTMRYRNFFDLFNEFDRLNLKPIYNIEFITPNVELNLKYYYHKYQTTKGFTFKNIDELTHVYLYGDLIIKLNHKKKKAYIEDTLLIDDFARELYGLISNPVYQFNLELNRIRDKSDIINLSLDSEIVFNNILLRIQEHFNEFNQIKKPK